MKFNEFVRNNQNTDRYKEFKSDIEKIIEEWEIVKSIYDLIGKIMQECEIDFELENFKDKKFIIIKHENYNIIKMTLSESIKIMEECLEKNESFKYSDKTITKLKNFKNNIVDLNELILHFEACQIRLENNMVKATVLQKNQDQFMKLKQAELSYKSIIDFVQDNPKILNLLRVKDTINETINTLTGDLDELPYGLGEYIINK